VVFCPLASVCTIAVVTVSVVVRVARSEKTVCENVSLNPEAAAGIIMKDGPWEDPVLNGAASDRETPVLNTTPGAWEMLILGVGCISPVIIPAPVLKSTLVTASETLGQPALGRMPEVSVNSVPSALATHRGMAPTEPPSCRAVRGILWETELLMRQRRKIFLKYSEETIVRKVRRKNNTK